MNKTTRIINRRTNATTCFDLKWCRLQAVAFLVLMIASCSTASDQTLRSTPLESVPKLSNASVAGVAVGGQESPGAAAGTKEPIKIGAITSFTGSQAYLGSLLSIGYDIAVSEINSAGGVNGRPLKILYEDEKGDPKAGTTAYQKLVEVDNVKIVLPTLSGTVLAIAPLAEKSQVISFSPIGASTKIAQAGDYTFRIREKGEKHGKAVAEFAMSRGLKRAAVLSVASENGVSYRDAFESRFKELGGTILFSETYETGTPDFRTQLTKIKELSPDAVFLTGFAKEPGEQLKEAAEVGLKTQFLGTAGVEDDQLLAIAGPAAEGLIYSSPLFDLDSSEPRVKAFADKLRSKTNASGTLWIAANAYDSLFILSGALTTCGENTTCLKAELYKLKDYPGIGGSVTFDIQGEVDKPIGFRMVRNGRFSSLT